jgi:hypothetical protein
MAVFTYRIMDALYNVVRRASNDLLGESDFRLSPDDFIATFVRSEHVGPLKTTESLVGSVGDSSTSSKIRMEDNNRAGIYIRFVGTTPPIILPPYIVDGPNPFADPAIVAKLTEYVTERVRLGLMFGDALDTLHYLNDNCGNASAMAVMFPCLPAMFTEAGRFENDPESQHYKRATRIREAKTFGTLPRVLPEVKDRMLMASNLIQNVMMLDKSKGSSTKSKHGEAIISVSHVEVPYENFIYASLGQEKAASFV